MRDFNAEACAVNERFADGEITEEEQKELLDNLETELYAQNAWAPFRETGYPSVAKQLDMLWHAIDEGALDKTSDFYVQIKAIKDKFPKPE